MIIYDKYDNFKFAYKHGLFICQKIKGELRPEISLLHMKVLTLIKAKSNVLL